MTKRILIIFLSLLLLFMFGCAGKNDDIEQPVNFYYHNSLLSEENFDRIIVSEIREGAGFTKEELVGLYLRGPQSEELENPFPEGLRLVSVSIKGKRVKITVSRLLGKLDGIQLTLACSCLSATLFDLYGCQTVEIVSEGQTIDGKPSIIINKDDLALTDSSYVSGG